MLLGILVEFIFTAVFIALAVEAEVSGLNAVVDLSHWNPNVNFARAKADGIFGVIHKASQGLAFKDPRYESRKTEATSLGIKWGAYHFANGSDGVEQAKFYLKVVGEDPNTLLALDLEENPDGPTVNLTIAEDFVRTVYEARGRYPLIYGSKYFLRDMVSGTKSVLLDCPLWFARWADEPDVPENTWSNWTLWQYTDGRSGPKPHTVNGIGSCDRDTINNALHSSIENMWDTVGRPQIADGTRVPMNADRSERLMSTEMPISTRYPTGFSTTPKGHKYSNSDPSEENTATTPTPYGTAKFSTTSRWNKYSTTPRGHKHSNSDSSEEITATTPTPYGTAKYSTTSRWHKYSTTPKEHESSNTDSSEENTPTRPSHYGTTKYSTTPRAYQHSTPDSTEEERSTTPVHYGTGRPRQSTPFTTTGRPS